MTYWLYRFCAWLLYYTHEAIGYRLFGLIGLLAMQWNGKARAQATANMRNVLGPGASEHRVRQVVREAFRNHAWNYYDLFHMRAFKPEAIRRRLRVEGEEQLQAAFAAGKGALLTTLHFGNLELMIQVPLLYPWVRCVVLVEKMADERLFQLMSRLRASQGVELVPVDQLLRVMRSLKRNRAVGIAADRDVTNSGTTTCFFGKPARLPDGAVRIALRTGAPIIPAYGWRERDGRFRARILPPLALQCTGDVEADVRANMATVAGVLEGIIREHPGQWMAFHPLWVNEQEPCQP